MTPTTLFLYIVMAGLGLAALFVVGLALWVLYLALKGVLAEEPAPGASTVPRPKRRRVWPFARKAA